MKELVYVWLIIIVILAILTFFFLAMYLRCTLTRFRPEDCSTITGMYGISPSTTATTVRTCGDSKNELCSFTVPSLKDAIDKCNDFGDKCWAFTFSDTQMNIVDVTTKSTGSPKVDLFLKRVNAISLNTSLI